MKTLRTLRYGALVCGMAALALVGCSDTETPTNTSKAATYYGDTATLGNGTATSWVKVDDDGNPTSVGVTLSETALDGLSTGPFPSGPTLSLPSQTASMLAYNHITVDWNAEGHEPQPIYTLPHFDFHFYIASEMERVSFMDSAKGAKPVDPDYVPTGYFTPGGLVPGMGVHWVDPSSPELDTAHHHTFDKTFIYGFYDAKMVFAEPMITRAYLLTKPNVTEDLKLPAKYPKAGRYYATKYSIAYNETAKTWTVSLDGLTKR